MGLSLKLVTNYRYSWFSNWRLSVYFLDPLYLMPFDPRQHQFCQQIESTSSWFVTKDNTKYRQNCSFSSALFSYLEKSRRIFSLSLPASVKNTCRQEQKWKEHGTHTIQATAATPDLGEKSITTFLKILFLILLIILLNTLILDEFLKIVP